MSAMSQTPIDCSGKIVAEIIDESSDEEEEAEPEPAAPKPKPKAKPSPRKKVPYFFPSSLG